MEITDCMKQEANFTAALNIKRNPPMTTETETVADVVRELSQRGWTSFAQRIAAAHAREVGAKQAEIDRLMLEMLDEETKRMEDKQKE